MEYITADPTGNITILIETPYEPESRNEMIRQAFDSDPACEQAGFIVPGALGAFSGSGTRLDTGASDGADGAVSLEMMGYEFCGNAALSAAACQAYLDGVQPGSSAVIKVDSSGVEDPVRVELIRHDDMPYGPDGINKPVFTGTLAMPVPSEGHYRDLSVIHLDGISHIIAPEGSFSNDDAEAFLRCAAAELGIPAAGLIQYASSDPENVSIRPLVYVVDSDTMVWEHGCATGSTAIAWYRYIRDGFSSTRVNQPGGTIIIGIRNGRPYMTGRVILTYGIG